MKKFKKTLALALAAAVSVSTVFVASPAEAQAAKKNTVSVTLKAKAAPTNATISGVKKTLTIVATYNKKTVKASKVKYTIDKKDQKVVSINKKTGVVTSKKTGTATVTVKYTVKKKTYSAKVKVAVIKPTTKVKLDKTKTSVDVGKKVTLKATPTPKDTTDKVEWKTSNKKVATVSKGVVKGVAVGTATITATSGSKKATAKITVNPTTFKKANTTSSVTVGKTTTLKATVKPSGSKVTWSTSNKKVATVSKGVVKGVKAGTATIKATCGGKSLSWKITVKDAVKTVTVKLGATTLEVGKTTKATATIAPSTADNNVTWTSSNEKVAKVNKSTGVVTAVAAGQATITATANNGKKGTATITVKAVTPAVKEITAVKITSTAKEVTIGEAITLTAAVEPSNATTDTTITWSSKAENVATVDQKGVVTGVTAGTAEIVATTKNGKTDSVFVTVNPIVDGARIDDGVSYIYNISSTSKVSKGSATSVVAVADLIKSDLEKIATKTNKTWTADTMVEDLTDIFAKVNNSALLKKAGTSLFAANVNPVVSKNANGSVKVVIGSLTYDNITLDTSDANVQKLAFTSGAGNMTAEIKKDASSITIKNAEGAVVFSFATTAAGYEVKLNKAAYNNIASVLAKDFVSEYKISK